MQNGGNANLIKVTAGNGRLVAAVGVKSVNIIVNNFKLSCNVFFALFEIFFTTRNRGKYIGSNPRAPVVHFKQM